MELCRFFRLISDNGELPNNGLRFWASLSVIHGMDGVMRDEAEILIHHGDGSTVFVTLIGADKLMRANLPTRYRADRHWMKCTNDALIVYASETEGREALVWIRPRQTE